MTRDMRMEHMNQKRSYLCVAPNFYSRIFFSRSAA